MRLSLNLSLPEHDLRIGRPDTYDSSFSGFRTMSNRSSVGYQGREYKRFYPLIIALEALTKINEWQWQRLAYEGQSLPLLYDSGVFYEQEPIAPQPQEEWLDVIELYKQGKGDCEDLACARAGELRHNGIAAVPCIRYKLIGSITLIHVQVLWPDGFIEDPSKRLGMKGGA